MRLICGRMTTNSQREENMKMGEEEKLSPEEEYNLRLLNDNVELESKLNEERAAFKKEISEQRVDFEQRILEMKNEYERRIKNLENRMEKKGYDDFLTISDLRNKLRKLRNEKW